MNPRDHNPGREPDPARGRTGSPPGGHPGGRPGDVQQTPSPGTHQQGPAGGVQQPQPIPEMSVSTPTLRRISIADPRQQVPLGEDDYVLNSFYNPQIDSWMVLVLVQPADTEEEEEEE